MLGRNPGTRLICASYSQNLADKFSRDCQALLDTPFYRRVFPRSRLNPKKNSGGEFETTRRGYRLATSVGGTLSLPKTQIRTYRWCSPPRIGCAMMLPNR